MDRAEHNLSMLRQCRQQWYLMLASNSGRKKSEIQEDLLFRLKNQLICIQCGERHYATLDFHHTDPTLKDFAISEAKGKDLEKILNEAEKCEILCSNCHRKHHAKERMNGRAKKV